jgi:hypothetical protein
MNYTHRIRRCEGDKKSWLLCALDSHGEEILVGNCYVTGPTIDHLLKYSRGLLPDPDDCIQLVYYPEPAP